eukprot:CAMPEP_0179106270 /NCGR_PEP_ID=MMETSP0796-20121207/49403_1 /TAXON_ID=73915 /ORGANISM="Pyrodinium bahamense, Strain pbaha01" /LENGTH=141 /DNA_ID=CAMNT_0020804295 /DNA_START=283 /DNA_END=709 /DNA_ORIENTATION=+
MRKETVREMLELEGIPVPIRDEEGTDWFPGDNAKVSALAVVQGPLLHQNQRGGICQPEDLVRKARAHPPLVFLLRPMSRPRKVQHEWRRVCERVVHLAIAKYQVNCSRREWPWELIVLEARGDAAQFEDELSELALRVERR